MAITRKDTKALLAILWETANDAYTIGYNHGRNGADNPQSPYPPYKAIEHVTAKELDALKTQLNGLVDKLPY